MITRTLFNDCEGRLYILSRSAMFLENILSGGALMSTDNMRRTIVRRADTGKSKSKRRKLQQLQVGE